MKKGYNLMNEKKKALNQINLSAAAKFAEQYAKSPESSIRSALKATDLSKAEQLAFLHKDIEDQRSRYLGMLKATESMLESQKMHSSLHKNFEEAHSKYKNIRIPSDFEAVEKNFMEHNSNLIKQQNQIQKEKQEKKELELKQFELFENMHNTQCEIIELAKSSSLESEKERKYSRIITYVSLTIAIMALIPPYLDFFSEETPPTIMSDATEDKIEMVTLPVEAEIDANDVKTSSDMD
ncbi:hypothetical protein ACXITX_04310 [Vibrio parahaemolyticus]|uniref:hypothetical protein n=1 Tax=Vibrio TaxID=662 RepID=UPI0011233134|nr:MULTISPECIES: hypothetical protein [Vibrio]MCS0409047.1 hypothetical protein [Vibrio diabolicus]EGR0395698.1 hypothetical protein [Vibrio parahaemolyticus]EJI1423953.1 hypothetical protein [Vibrio parahaemolyticus]MBE4517000.1 hypothetical protein [Vibrio parahaemolyticus]MCI9718627.1 hypothetical protein [Vibrio parahaemolyticus]